MKQSKLSKLENNIYYSISRYFWHIIIGLAVLGIVIGIFVLLWTHVPVKKETVVKAPKPVKEAYPPKNNVPLEKILFQLPKKSKKTKKVNKQSAPEIEAYVIEETTEEVSSEPVDSTAIYNFENELGVTKNLIPYNKNKSFWNGAGHYGFKSERDRKLFKKTKNPKYRVWIKSEPGFKGKFIAFTNRNRLKNYNDKTQLLGYYNKFLEKIDTSNRVSFVNRVLLNLPVKRIGVYKVDNLLTSIGNVLNKIDKKDQLNTYNILYNFSRNNPNDGLALIDFESRIIDSVASKNRYNFIKRIQNEYVNNYNNNLSSLKEATEQFLPYLKQIPVENQIDALDIYYKLYRLSNQERSRKIKQIDQNYRRAIKNWERDYQQRLSSAEAAYRLKKNEKKSIRQLTYKEMLGSFLTILLISIVLLILSMIRNVNRLSEAILENNKLFSEYVTKEKDEVTNENNAKIPSQKSEKKKKPKEKSDPFDD